jgi:hypothetical protein
VGADKKQVRESPELPDCFEADLIEPNMPSTVTMVDVSPDRYMGLMVDKKSETEDSETEDSETEESETSEPHSRPGELAQVSEWPAYSTSIDIIHMLED